jgi:hypothetical protein
VTAIAQDELPLDESSTTAMGSGSSILETHIRIRIRIDFKSISLSVTFRLISDERFFPVFSADDHRILLSASIACTMVLRIFSKFFPPRLSTPAIAVAQYIAAILVEAGLYRLKCQKCSSDRSQRDGQAALCASLHL